MRSSLIAARNAAALGEVAAKLQESEIVDMGRGGPIRLGLAGLGVAASCAAAQAQPAPTFPAEMERTALVAWLRQETDIAPAQVVAVSASAVTAVLGAIETTEPRGVRLALRAEAIDPQVSGREGVLSWHMVVEVDCAGHRLRTGATTGYAGRNLLGEGREIRPGADTWSEPKAGSQLESVWRTACEPAFQRPLTATRVAAAAAMPAAARSPQPPQLRAMMVQSLGPPAQAAPAPVSAPKPEVPAPRPRSTATVQIGAMSTHAAAAALLASFRARFTGAMHGLSTSVTPVSAGGRTVYRALVGGFARAADAGQFCAGMKASGVACLIRR